MMMMIRVLAATDRAQCAGRGLGPGQSGTARGQTRLHRASGLHPGDHDYDDNDDDDDCIIQDRRRGNPAWSWTHNHKEYPTGKCCFLHTPSCFCLLASLDQNKILENIPPRHNHSLSPGERVVLKETNWLSFCVLYLWSVVMKCIATPSLSYNSLALILHTKFYVRFKKAKFPPFLPNLSVLYISPALFVLQFPIWQALASLFCLPISFQCPYFA